MGIRYSAYPVQATDIELARREPRHFINDNPLVGFDGPYDEWFHLDLDKSWHYLQRLFTWPHSSPAERGLELVEGNVHYLNSGEYEPHFGVLDPDQVDQVARAIFWTDKVDVLAMLIAENRSGDRLRDDTAYVGHHLEAAKRFTARVAEAGHGLIYSIG